MVATKTQQSKKTAQFQVVELVRRQGIYTGTLQIDSVEEVERILNSFTIADRPVQAVQSAKATCLEFNAVGGRTGIREYCLRFPNIKIEDLTNIGFKEDPVRKDYIRK